MLIPMSLVRIHFLPCTRCGTPAPIPSRCDLMLKCYRRIIRRVLQWSELSITRTPVPTRLLSLRRRDLRPYEEQCSVLIVANGVQKWSVHRQTELWTRDCVDGRAAGAPRP